MKYHTIPTTFPVRVHAPLYCVYLTAAPIIEPDPDRRFAPPTAVEVINPYFGGNLKKEHLLASASAFPPAPQRNTAEEGGEGV